MEIYSESLFPPLYFEKYSISSFRIVVNAIMAKQQFSSGFYQTVKKHASLCGDKDVNALLHTQAVSQSDTPTPCSQSKTLLQAATIIQPIRVLVVNAAGLANDSHSGLLQGAVGMQIEGLITICIVSLPFFYFFHFFPIFSCVFDFFFVFSLAFLVCWYPKHE